MDESFQKHKQPVKQFLDQRANKFLLHRLSVFGGSLSKIFLKNTSIDRGVLWTFVPAGTNGDKIYELNASLQDVETISQGEKIVPVEPIGNHELFEIRQHLNSGVCYCVIEEFEARKGAPFLGELVRCAYYKGNEIFYILGPRDHEFVETALSGAPGDPYFFAFLVKGNLETCLRSPNRELTVECLERMASHVVGLIISAYDNEGYVFWKPIETVQC